MLQVFLFLESILVCQLNWLDKLSDLFSSFLWPSMGYQGRQAGIFSGAYEVTWDLYKFSGKRGSSHGLVLLKLLRKSLGIIGVLYGERIWLPGSAWNRPPSGTFSTLLPVLSHFSHCCYVNSVIFSLLAQVCSSGQYLFPMGWPSVTSTGSFVTNTGPDSPRVSAKEFLNSYV